MFSSIGSIAPVEIKTLTDEQVARSSIYPYPEALYASGPWRCEEKILLQVETDLGFKLPTELRAWYLEVGVCRIPFGEQTPYSSPNNVLMPTHMPQLVGGICSWMEPDIVVEPRTLPFFERDAGLFVCVHPFSANPNAVHWMWGECIGNSVAEFFRNMLDNPDWLGVFKPRGRRSSPSPG